jgi:hypothetical protein
MSRKAIDAILRSLNAVEQIEADLWIQYSAHILRVEESIPVRAGSSLFAQQYHGINR